MLLYIDLNLVNELIFKKIKYINFVFFRTLINELKFKFMFYIYIIYYLQLLVYKTYGYMLYIIFVNRNLNSILSH